MNKSKDEKIPNKVHSIDDSISNHRKHVLHCFAQGYSKYILPVPWIFDYGKEIGDFFSGTPRIVLIYISELALHYN